MGITIIMSILIGLSLILLILAIILEGNNYGWKYLFKDGTVIGAIILVVPVNIIFTILIVKGLKEGRLSQAQRDEFIKNKIHLEYNLSQKDKYFFDYLDDAKEHNEQVNSGNNLFLRFNIEDRSEYLINIDYYKSTLIGGE